MSALERAGMGKDKVSEFSVDEHVFHGKCLQQRHVLAKEWQHGTVDIGLIEARRSSGGGSEGKVPHVREMIEEVRW